MLDFPLYNAVIEGEEDGIYCLSLVSEPATEIQWQCFEKNREQLQFNIDNEEKHIISTVVMTANVPIYRRDGDYEYYIQYSPSTIAVMAEKLLKDNAFQNYDLQHNGELLPKNAVSMLELYIVDREKGINPTFIDVPDGSLMCSLKIHDEGLWEMAKDGTLNGISLAGYFSVKEANRFSKNNKDNKTRKMMSNIKEALKKILMQFGSVETDNGTLEYEGDTLEVGTEVTIDGNPAEDGDYKAEDGTVYAVKDGKVDSITEPEAEEPAEEEPAESGATEEVEAEEEPAESGATEDEPAEEEPVETPNEVEQLKGEIEALKSEIEAIKAQIAEIVNKPVAEPVAEEFEKVSKAQERMSKAAKIASYLNK